MVLRKCLLAPLLVEPYPSTSKHSIRSSSFPAASRRRYKKITPSTTEMRYRSTSVPPPPRADANTVLSFAFDVPMLALVVFR